MSSNGTVFSTALAMVILSVALVKGVIAQVPIRTGPSAPAANGRKPRQEPCWQVAGISKSAMQQRRAVTQQARREVEAVCANSSLSAQQRREQIQQIHERERQQAEALISPAQQDAMRSCQQGRNPGHGGGHVGGHEGPCGEMAVRHKANPQHEEDEMAPDESEKPN